MATAYPRAKGRFDGLLPARAICAAILLCAGVLIAVSLVEHAALGWNPAREEPALFSPYHWARMAVAASLALLLSASLSRHRDAGTAAAVRPGERAFGALVVVAAASTAGLLVIDPVAFHAFAAEDNLLEWGSALLLFLGGGLFLVETGRRLLGGGSRIVDTALALGLGGLLLLIGLEEISWGQRVIGFQTPETMAEMNWQSEFNLHNIQTDLSELAYYLGTGIFLIVLPMFRESTGEWAPMRRFAAFVPGRTAMLAGAPMLFLSYGHWNLLPIQLLALFGLCVMLLCARTAHDDGRTQEAALFATMAAVVAAGLAVVLAYGPTMVEIFDATEYREFFIALGLACFAVEYARRRPPHAEA